MIKLKNKRNFEDLAGITMDIIVIVILVFLCGVLAFGFLGFIPLYLQILIFAGMSVVIIWKYVKIMKCK